MNTKIIAAFVVAIALVGLTGAASADVITGSANYGYFSGGGFAGVGSSTWTSGMNLDLTVGTAVVAESDIGNTMTLAGNAVDPYVVLSSAAQYGYNSITLNNGQEPGEMLVDIRDFESTSESGGAVSAISEDMGSVTFDATSTSNEANTGFITKDVTVTDTNTVASTADPDKVGGSGCHCNDPSVMIKQADFTWDCWDQAMVMIQNTEVEHAEIGTGIAASAHAKGKLVPGNYHGGITTHVDGTQNIHMDIVTPTG